uniref:G-protein coupled receptors family 1 profile domain-containing protein n=1 Tax=Panagrolaimus davidi TaxID=227884 RepID=A0A914QJ57_9BILA
MGTFGIFGNSLSAFIYSRKSMKSSINTYLCALAFSDITVIVTSFFLFFLESMRKRSSIASRFFALFASVTFPLGLTAQSMSVFLTIAGAFDCFILVIGTDSIKSRICTPRIAKRVSASFLLWKKKIGNV